MPFTFSHLAIVLPLAYFPRWFSLTGLIIGSMVPDFEYFLRMRLMSEFSHTIAGIFWFNLPLALLLCFVYHNIIRDSLFNNLPPFLNSRLIGFTGFNWNQYFRKNPLKVLTSILIGVTSHLLWDSFTHSQGYFAENIPGLKERIIIYGMEIRHYKILQHGSTFIGAMMIGFVIWKLPGSPVRHLHISTSYWLFAIVVFLLVMIFRFSAGLEITLYGNVIASMISAGLIALFLTSLFYKFKNTLS